jgi:hypothetical protein
MIVLGWNETYPTKQLSLAMPVIQLWQNPCNPSYSIPLGRNAPSSQRPLLMRSTRLLRHDFFVKLDL